MKKNTKILTLVFVVAFLTLLIGCLPGLTPPTPKGVISGRIMVPSSETTKDITGWIPVANATVTLIDSKGVTHTVTTDKDGYYTFTDIAVNANTIITATATIDGTTVITKDIIPQAVAADGDYDAGTADAESTALALIVEELLEQGFYPGAIDLEEIQDSDNFTEVVEQITSILEENGNITTDPGLDFTVGNVAEDIISPPVYMPPEETPEPEYTPPTVTPAVNHPPIITSTQITTATVGIAYTYDVEATDPDDDTLIYFLITKPDGMLIDENSGVITWTPTAVGSFDVTVKVSDGELSDTESFMITVVVTVIGPIYNTTQGTYYNTIQVAIDYAKPGDAIEVAAGTYNEAVSIDKQLTLLGAQYNVDPTVEGARIDESAESIIDAGGSSAVVSITADSVSLNGFTITNGGGVAPSHIRGGVYLSGTLVSGCTISNNKITENLRDGIDSCSSGSGVNVFENNVISNNDYGAIFFGRYEGGDIFRNNVISYNADLGQTGQIGIQSSDNIVEDNTINGDSLYGILIMGSGVDIRENNILRRNIINRGESGPGFTVGGICITYAKNTLVEDNTIHNNVTGVSVGGSTDTTSLRGNDIQGNDEYGIKVGYPGYDTKDTTIEENDVLSNEVGIWIRSDIAASTTHINQNNIVGNIDYGVLNEISTPVDAIDNWWGSTGGPYHETTNPFAQGNSVSDNVDFRDWSEYAILKN